ncbi:MAG: ABC transporter ATP-binding protein [Promethearchaeota archaeon]
MTSIIEFSDFYWKYKSSKDLVLKSINLKINKGDFVGVMGPTGAGKSTLCFCINGLIPLRTRGWIKGTVEIFGKNTRTAKMHELGTRIGLIFQDPETQFIMMTVEDEIAIGLETLGLERNDIKERIEWALRLVGLEGYEEKSPDELSGGQKQRIAIASIMAMRPEILILDEPTSDLDPQGKQEIFEVLESIRKEFDLTIILVSHDTKKVIEFCNRIILIDDGEIKLDESTSQLSYHIKLLNELGIYHPTDALDYQESLEQKIESKLEISKKNPIIDINNLSFSYPNQTQALKNINLKIFSSDFIAIIGKNGSGKTTLIKHFNGLLKPQQGNVQLKNKSINEYSISKISQIIGYCYQNPDHQLFKNTIREEIEFGLKNLKFHEREIERRYNEIIELLDLKKFEEIYKSTFYLSKGIRQRLALASVLVLKPEILIIDEPTTGQDYRMIEEFMKILKNLHENNSTIIIVTHDPRVIAKYSKEVIILDNGYLIKKLPTRKFLKDKELQKIAAYIPP